MHNRYVKTRDRRLEMAKEINPILNDVMRQQAIQVIDGVFRELFVSLSSKYTSYQGAPPGIKQICFKFYFISTPQMMKRILATDLKKKDWCFKRIPTQSTGSKYSHSLYPAIVEKYTTHRTGKHGHRKFLFYIRLPHLGGQHNRFMRQHNRFLATVHTIMEQPIITKYQFKFVSFTHDASDNARNILVNAQSKSIKKVFSLKKESTIYQKMQQLVEDKQSDECIYLTAIHAPIIHLDQIELSKCQSIKVTRLWAILDAIILIPTT
eukprot:503593_1